MNLPKRRLGQTTLEITTLGFGTWAIGGGGWAFSWGPQGDDASLAAMRHAVEQGINWIDTAAVYGLGHSEELVGKFLRDLPPSERPYVFTKCGLQWDKDKPMEAARRVLTPETVRAECEASLRRLGVERIDLYQFHWPDESGSRIEDAWAAMSRLVSEGKVRTPGVCNFSVELMERCEPIQHVDSLQPPFSLIRRETTEKELPWCAEHKTGIICYSPMQSGLLTDSFSEERARKFAKDDWRRRSDQFQQPKLKKNLALRDALKPIAKRHQSSVAEVAIAWTLCWPGVTGAIVGARSPEQVDGWIRAASLDLNSADMDEIAAAIQRTGAGDGPSKPMPPNAKTHEARQASVRAGL